MMGSVFTLGPFLFLAPLALLTLIALPIIWLVLRATPPSPQNIELPSLRLLDNIDGVEETPARTPWWILLLRLLAAILIIFGLSQPIYAPNTSTENPASGSLLVVIDDGWQSAQRWSELQDVALSALDGENRDTPAHILLTAPRALNLDPAERLDRPAYIARIRSLRPVSWQIDRQDALLRLSQSELNPSRILYLSDGLDPSSATDFVTALSEIAPLTIFAATPRGPIALSALRADANGVHLTGVRLAETESLTQYVSALTLDGRALATTELVFAPNVGEATASFYLPAAATSQIARFQLTGQQSAGAIWLWDSATRSRRVGLVSGDSTAQPLLSDVHYIRKALEPFADITEAPLNELMRDDPDAIVVTDIGQIDPAIEAELIEWIDTGGVLIRFAGPRMAAQGDRLVPVPLRRASRAIGGGTLTWETPQTVDTFDDSSPFLGLSVPNDIRIRQQVLARPGPDLASRTWARLSDGSPLITAEARGNGTLVLFHITAGPDWSDLPYSGAFVELLRRTIAAGQGRAVDASEGLYSPSLILDGFGRLQQPDANAAPIQASDFTTLENSETHPPGLYLGASGLRAVNAGADYQAAPITAWPASANLIGDLEARPMQLGGLLLALGLSLVVLDLLLAITLAGRLRLRRVTQFALFGLAVLVAAPQVSPAAAQYRLTPPPNHSDLPKDVQAALQFRLAYIATGDPRADRAMRAGLEGLGLTLFRRSSVEPAAPHAVDLENDALHVYPILFLSLPESPTPLSTEAIARLNAYLRDGGALFIDTRLGDGFGSTDGFSVLQDTFAGLDTPQLTPVPNDHVLTRSFYLLDGFPGRYANRPLWIESTAAGAKEDRRGDGVSRIFVGDADYMAAWAIDERGAPLYSVDGGETQREQALRFGVNLIIYVLTGNYKEDQVHIPALLERLGDDAGVGDFDSEPDDILSPDEGVIP